VGPGNVATKGFYTVGAFDHFTLLWDTVSKISSITSYYWQWGDQSASDKPVVPSATGLPITLFRADTTSVNTSNALKPWSGPGAIVGSVVGLIISCSQGRPPRDDGCGRHFSSFAPREREGAPYYLF